MYTMLEYMAIHVSRCTLVEDYLVKDIYRCSMLEYNANSGYHVTNVGPLPGERYRCSLLEYVVHLYFRQVVLMKNMKGPFLMKI